MFNGLTALWKDLCFRAIVLATLIVAVSFAVFLPPVDSPNGRGDNPNDKPSNYVCDKLSYIDRLTDPITILTFFLVVSTAGLWFVTAQSSIAASKSADIAERALVAGQRAFVSVTFESSAVTDIATGAVVGWNFTPIWLNSGETPTRGMHNHINIRLFDGQMPHDWDFPDLWNAMTPIADRVPIPLANPPKGSVRGQAVGVPIDVMRQVIAGTRWLYIWGWAAYRDVFPGTVEHITRFAVRVVAGGDPAVQDRMFFSFNFVRNYNCSDEECDLQGFPATWTPRELVE